jgi:alanyl aminopeptidase
MRYLLVAFAVTSLASAAPTPPKLRLDPSVVPVRYSAELKVDPTQTHFSGVIDIDVQSPRPLDVLWLNAEELQVQKASATVGKKTIAAKVIPQKKDFVGIAFDAPLAAGVSRVHLEYTGRLAEHEATGATIQTEEGLRYAMTQFEPIDARRVFPCFDEPSFKVPWKLALIIKNGDKAFANTPDVETKDLGGGWKRVQFAESKPLPSYLVAWGVGPFDVVDGGRSKVSGTRVRIIVPKGQQARARWAAESTHQALEQLEQWFGTRYPFEKLDCMDMPLAFFGAMENPGLITFKSSLIMQKPEEETIAKKRAYAEVATHELAHQWFGDLVTPSWWDDIWLNEAFATWMTPKIIESWQPTWGAAESRIKEREEAMGADALVSARRIRQPIDSNDDIKTCFDDITYQKGSTVIGMFERLVGADAFRRGVQEHLKKHARGNATATEFLASISAAAGRDIAPAFSTFLDQAGVPTVSVDLVCDKTPHLHLTQTRYLPKGSPGATGSAEQLWKIPVCARWPDGQACTLLTEKSGDLPLGKSCPAWVEPNDGGNAYYHIAPSAGLRKRLIDAGLASLTAPEKLSLVSDLDAQVRAGNLELSELMKLAARLAGDKSRQVVESVLRAVGELRRNELVAPAQKAKYAAWLRSLFGARAHQLGWAPRPGDDEDARLLRAHLVPTIAAEGEDASLSAEAAKLADAWLVDHKAVDPDMVDGVLSVAAAGGDAARYQKWLAAAKATKDRLEQERLLLALSMYRDPSLVKDSLALVVGDVFEPAESLRLMWGASKEPSVRAVTWSWLQSNFEKLVAKLPRDEGPYLAWVPVGLCDEATRQLAVKFYEPRLLPIEGGQRELAQAMEELQLCAVYKTDQTPSVARFLAGVK